MWLGSGFFHDKFTVYFSNLWYCIYHFYVLCGTPLAPEFAYILWLRFFMGWFSPSTSISNKDNNSLQVTSLCHDVNSFWIAYRGILGVFNVCWLVRICVSVAVLLFIGERLSVYGVLRTALFWVVTHRIVVISYRRFGTTYRSHPQGSRLILEPWGWDRYVARKIDNKLSLLAEPWRDQFSAASRRKPKATHMTCCFY